jgi:hypothetical protein
MNDGTLSAIVAADRLALSEVAEGKELLHRRPTVFYGYFALLGALAVIAGSANRVLVDVDPRVLAFVFEVQVAHALVLCAIFIALCFGVQERRMVRGLDIFATVSTSATAAVAGVGAERARRARRSLPREGPATAPDDARSLRAARRALVGSNRAWCPRNLGNLRPAPGRRERPRRPAINLRVERFTDDVCETPGRCSI